MPTCGDVLAADLSRWQTKTTPETVVNGVLACRTNSWSATPGEGGHTGSAFPASAPLPRARLLPGPSLLACPSLLAGRR
jgi:hypothetical protein